MPAHRLTVVLSQGQSQNPAKRSIEEDIAAALLVESGVELAIVPHLYDLHEGHTGLLFLRNLPGDIVVLSWIFPRAARWALHRAGVRGLEGTVQLQAPVDDDESENDESSAEPEPAAAIIGPGEVPKRYIYVLDLRDFDSAQPYIDEVRRIANEVRVTPVPIQLSLSAAVLPPPLAVLPSNPAAETAPAAADLAWIAGTPNPQSLMRFLDPTPRRWYPVIDFSRCTNCLECIDFCLFGVYGVSSAAQILVEQPDNCRKGCPACSRVCPENAIIFPMHKTPAIAGAPGEGPGAIKIDLSRLFGAPDAIDVAAQERDVELVRAGRDAVGLSVGIPKRQVGKPQGPKDDLDTLIDELDALSL